MTRAENVLELARGEGFPSLRRRLRGIAAGLLYLVVPEEARALASPVRVRLLARLAERAPFRLVLVSGDRELRRRAEAEGLPAFASLNSARSGKLPLRQPRSSPQGSFNRIGARRAMQPGGGYPAAIALNRPATIPATWNRIEGREAALLIGLAAGTLLVFLVAAVLIIPGARVEIPLATYPVVRTVVLRVEAGIGSSDPEILLIAGRTVEIGLAGREQAATAAKRDVPDEPARGNVIFVNRRAESTVVPAGSIVSTSAGTIIRFQTVEEVVVPPGLGAQARAEVEAVEPGLTGNVPALTVNRVEAALALQVGVLNDEPMLGGTVQQAGYVTAEEKARLRSALLQRLQLEGENSLREGMEGEILLPGSVSVEVLREIYDQPVGEIADLLSLEMRVVVSGIAVSEEDLHAVTLEALSRDLDPSFQVVEQDLALLPGELTSAEDGFELDLTVQGRFFSGVDLDSLRERLRGVSASDASAYLERHLDLSAPPSIVTSPSWWGRLPLVAWRMEMVPLPEEG